MTNELPKVETKHCHACGREVPSFALRRVLGEDVCPDCERAARARLIAALREKVENGR